MSRKMNKKTGIWLVIGVCTTAYVALFLAISSNIAVWNGTNFNGVLQAFQLLSCVIMVCVGKRRGTLMACVLMAISAETMVCSIFMAHNMLVIPGLCNMVVQAGTLLLLRRQLRRREKESVTDSLTGLKNRRGLYEVLRESIAARKKIDVINIDLVNFKQINELYGHIYGYEVLCELAKRISDLVASRGAVCRMGGNEFAVVLKGQYEVQEFTETLLHLIERPVELAVEGREIECYVVTKAGVASYPEHAADEDTLMKCAEFALYQAEREKNQKICYYDDDLHNLMLEKKRIEMLVKEGLSKDYFYLVYQPQYRMKDKSLRGFETLLRMRTPDGSMISPGQFIPVAEESDLILQIDDYVIDRAMDEIMSMIEITGEKLVTSINVSARNIASTDFADRVIALINAKNFPGDALEIEITEYNLVESMERTIHNMVKLREYGVQFALDDFGTGYSSLSYLAELPIDLLKVDKSLVDNVIKDETGKQFAKTVVSLGHLIGCEVIAEGVEEEAQLQELKSFDCDLVQGFLWGKPIEYKNAIDLIKASGE